MTKIIREDLANISRRKFIVGSAAAAGGGLALGLNVPLGVAEYTISLHLRKCKFIMRSNIRRQAGN